MAAGHLEPGLGRLQCSVGGVDYYAGVLTGSASAVECSTSQKREQAAGLTSDGAERSRPLTRQLGCWRRKKETWERSQLPAQGSCTAFGAQNLFSRPASVTGDFIAGQLHSGLTYTAHAADLKPSGEIAFEGKVFRSPSAFSVYVKRKVNPSRKADDGWTSVKYGVNVLSHFRGILQELTGGEQAAGQLRLRAWRSVRECAAK